MGGFWGSHLGLIDLMLERDGKAGRSSARPARRGRSSSASTRRSCRRSTSKAEVEAAVKDDHEATLDYVRTPVGKTSAPLYSYFALVADDPSVQIVSQAQTWYIKDMLKETEYKDLPVLSAAAPFKAGGRGGADYYTDVPAGDVAIKNVADLYLYPNTVQAVVITGAQVKEWLEMSAGIFNTDRAGQGRPAADQPRFPVLQFRRDRRRHLQDRPVAAAEIRAQGRGAQRLVEPHRRPACSTASRSIRRRNSSSPRTITAPAAAAISRRSTDRR